MFDTIILLTGPAEREALSTLLKRHNARLDLRIAGTRAELESFDKALLRRSRLVAFLTPVIVPKQLLDRLGFGAYNFHPGPPEYPGWVPCHFAVYDRVKRFGATAHRMVVEVDAGPIVDVELFDVPPGTGVFDLEKLAFTAAARLVWRLAQALACEEAPLQELPIKWCGQSCTRRRYEAICDIGADISAEELDRRLKAFGAGHFGIHPTITLNGRRFRYVG